MWQTFKCKTMGDYSGLYLKIDVLILAGVFLQFRKTSMQSQNLDPAHYLAFQNSLGMLKMSGKKACARVLISCI